LATFIESHVILASAITDDRRRQTTHYNNSRTLDCTGRLKLHANATADKVNMCT